MSAFADFKRLISGVKTKIFLLVGRGIVKAIKASEGTQLVQVVALEGETITDIERAEEYGFTAVPQTDSEAVAVFLNGNREQGIVLCISDRRYRPKDLKPGEVCVYDKNGTKILLDETGNLKITAAKNIDLTDVNGNAVSLSTTGVELKTGDAALWMPCIIGNCLFTGAPHGGTAAGIQKLKGN